MNFMKYLLFKLASARGCISKFKKKKKEMTFFFLTQLNDTTEVLDSSEEIEAPSCVCIDFSLKSAV